MEFMEINRNIEEAKNSMNIAKTEEEYQYYKNILHELRMEKWKILNKEFKRN